jgi:hypothetical protein
VCLQYVRLCETALWYTVDTIFDFLE